MLLISTTEAAAAIGAKCGGAQVSENEPELAQVLLYITPRVEAAMNVNSLTRSYYRDRFVLPQMPAYKPANKLPVETKLRLSNGYVVPNSLTLYAPDGSTVSDKYIDIDFNYGIVNVSDWLPGIYFAEYVSGFEAPDIPASPPEGYDSDLRVLTDVPDWIKALVVHLVVVWYRVARLNPRVPKDVSFTAIMNSLRHELMSRIYSAYQRPRGGCVFGEAR